MRAVDAANKKRNMVGPALRVHVSPKQKQI